MADAATFPLKTISSLLMLTDRRVQQLAAEGVIPKTERGRYELAPAVQGYIRYLKDRAVVSDAGAKAAGDLDLNEERARKAKEEADALEMKNAATRGELLPRGDVDAAMAAANARVRSRLIGVPSKVAAAVIAMESPAEAEAAIRVAVYDALKELAETSVIDLMADDEGGAEAA